MWPSYGISHCSELRKGMGRQIEGEQQRESEEGGGVLQSPSVLYCMYDFIATLETFSVEGEGSVLPEMDLTGVIWVVSQL